ncbi:oligoendopeptidase F [Oscillibacter sp. CAG:241]|nr:oligoendopeptidase F [Oscillibacter sp.]CDB26384.1 oligoendopeptidase F [Oscillibacter sp. CAG:241]
MTNQSIPKRSEVPEEMTWNLKDMFESDQAWMAEYEAMKEFPAKIAAFQGTLARSAQDLLAWFRLQDEIELRLSVLMGYASCKGDEDTGNSFYQDVRGKAMNVYVSIASAAAFATPEIMAIADETLDQFYAQQPELETYRRSLYQIRRRKDHILSPAEERLLASAGEMANASENIAGVFRNADQIFPDVTDSQGNVHPLTDATFVPLLTSPDRELRRRAFETYYKQLGQYKNTIAATLDGQFKQLCFFANARHYDSTIQASLDATEVPVPVYMNLIEAVHNNLDKMYRYVALRKKLLGVDELHMYDVYTPIVADADQAITYEQAKETVLEALQVLGDDYVDLLKEGFSNRWIDVYENVGKRSGAYSSGNSRPHPYVLLNHKDNLDCQFTLAHEMGHALHSYHSCKYQPVSTSDYVIFVAEVASTCNEVLLMRHLLKKTTDKKQRAYLINHFMDQFKGTVYRQTMFAEFELAMGKMAESGQALTADALCQKYHALNKLYFGPDMVSDDQIALEWARIPHFFYNYYVFQYATGFSAAVAIANRILKEGAPAVADYKKFLSGGCSTDPISLLKIAGVDMSSPEPVNSALALFGELVDEMEQLV